MWIWGAIGAVASIYGAYKASEGASQAGKARAAALRRNAEYLKSQARYAEQVAIARQSAYKKQAVRFRSRQSSMFAKAGVDLAGSVLQKLGETTASMEQQLHQIDWVSKNEIKFANVKARESLLTANAAEAAIPFQQATYWAQGIAGAAPGVGQVWKRFGG
jgi:hypothetical protein